MLHSALRAALCLCACFMSLSVAAQETRVGEDGFESPPASLEQMDWPVGQWVGDGIGGAPAMENWLPATGAIMVGTFVQQNGDGSVRFTEHLYLMEEAGSLTLRLKHFNDDLTGWEEKDDMLSFRLVAIEECAAYFNALTLRCADADRPGEGLVAAVRMQSGGELLFNFRPVHASAEVRAVRSYGCDGTTFAVNQCLAGVRDQAKAREKRYFDAAVAGRNGLSARITPRERSIRAAQNTAERYRSEVCNAVFDHWLEGSIRNAMALRCEIRLIDQRTHDIWRNWLTYQDASAPILPEPMPSTAG